MVSVSLLQRLEGDSAVASHSGEARANSARNESGVTESILANLRILLNSRQGCCETRPDYGLTDFSAASQNFRNSMSLMARDVEQQIRHFEPRLRNVVVRAVEDKMKPLELVFHVDGDLAFGDRTVRVAFNTVLGNDGHMRFNG